MEFNTRKAIYRPSSTLKQLDECYQGENVNYAIQIVHHFLNFLPAGKFCYKRQTSENFCHSIHVYVLFRMCFSSVSLYNLYLERPFPRVTMTFANSFFNSRCHPKTKLK